MSGVWTNERIRQEIDRLTDWRTRLSSALLQSASELKTIGLPPEDALVADLSDYRQRLQTLAHYLDAGRDQRLALSALSERFDTRRRQVGLIIPFRAILDLEHTSEPAFLPIEACRRDALALLAIAEDATATLDEPTAQALLDDRHPLQTLLMLVDQGETLSDEVWAQSEDLLADTYGRALSTAVARGRIRRSDRKPSEVYASTPLPPTRQVSVTDPPAVPPAPAPFSASSMPPIINEEALNASIAPSSSPPEVTTTDDVPSAEVVRATVRALTGSSLELPQPVETVAVETLVASASAASSREHATSSSADATSVFGDSNDDRSTKPNWFESGSSVLPGLTDVEAVVTEEPATPEEAALPEQPPIDWNYTRELPKPTWHSDALAELARQAMPLAGTARVEVLKRLVWQLIASQRLDLAAQLTRIIEAGPHGRGVLPAVALLRGCALSRRLSYARGELARHVDQVLRSVSPPADLANADDESFSRSLLMRAAALLPALLGASPAAANLLRSFPIEPGMSHLYNYCNRVAAFGERLQSQAIDLFQAPADQAQWQAERKQLQNEVRTWMEHSPAQAVVYTRESPLFLHAHWTMLSSATQRHPQAVQEWAQWQTVLLETHRLLRPARDGLDAERNNVRSDLKRLAGLVEETDATAALKHHEAFTPAMRTMMLEAIDLANRWLRLLSATPSRTLHLAPEHAEELRAELLERTAGVLAELNTLARTRTAEHVQIALVACRREIEHIQRLCAGEEPLPLHEPDPRHILSAEFLKMPHLELNEHWQPTADAAETEHAILEHLSCGWTDWTAAFALQCSQQDHLATARILELPVWPDPRMVPELHRVRNEELHLTRQAVLREVDELASQAALDVVERPELQPARQQLDDRLERLRYATGQLLTFHRVRARLERYRSHWARVLGGNQADLQDDSGILQSAPASREVHPVAESEAVNDSGWIFSEE